MCRVEEEPPFSTSIFLPSSSPEVSPTDQKHNGRFAQSLKGQGDMGTGAALSPTSHHAQNKASTAPWDGSAPHNSTAPWDNGLNHSGSKQASNNDSFCYESPGQLGPSFPTNTTATNGSGFSDPYQDIRRPSVASANTVSSQGSVPKASSGGKFHKSLTGFFGDDPTGSRQASVTNLHAQNTGKNGKGSDGPETPSRPHTPVPAADVTPWAYQNFEDVSNYGAAPVRTNPTEQEPDPAENSAPPSKDHHHHHRSLLHRHTKSKEEPQRSHPIPPTSHPVRPSTSRDSSSTFLPFGKSNTFASTPTGSSTTLQSTRTSSPGRAMTDRDFPDRKHSTAKLEKKGLRSLFSRNKHHEKDLSKTSTSSERSLLDSIGKNKSSEPAASPDKRGRETSMASTDSGATVRPPETTENLEKRSTNASKVSHRFPRMHPKRGTSYEGRSAEKARQDSQALQQQPAGMFDLDTDLDDMSGIISQPKPTSPDAAAADIFTGAPPKDSQGSMHDPAAPIWDAPDSWAVKRHEDEVLGALPEVDESGLPAKEDDGKSYCMRIFRTDSTFATISTSINATVADIRQMLAKKSVLQDSIENYHLVLRKHDLSRQLQNGERPVAMQKRMLEQAGYHSSDRIEEVGREDNSYLCRFTFTHRKLTGYGSALDKDPGFSKMQKFSHVDLQGRSLVTIPIILYKKATEIISINLSRNLALDIPGDFIQACVNLREIKFIGNEAWRLPASLILAGRLTVLDISNNRLEQLKSAALDRLSSLVSIKMANNRLSELPQYFANFRHLRSLLMSSNNFSEFPELICKMKALVDLDISFNKISALTNIGQVATLERLWVTNNDLKGPFNETFKNLVNLKEIDARFNGITNIDNVTHLPNLEMLLVGHNGISTFAGSFLKLRNLVMDHCPITSFDIDAPMPTLLSITLASAKLPSFKDSMFDNTPNLQKLNLDKNHFINMPLQIGRLSRLEHFSIAKNPLNTIPPSIGNLTELKFLNLRECNLKTLPSEIWYCLKLETLNVSSNVLESFPKMGTAPPQANAQFMPATTPGLSSSPSFEELGKLEDFGKRRPSQASGMYSAGSSPAGSQRKGSTVSGYGQTARKASVVSKTATDGPMTPVTRKDSNLSQTRFSNTFAGSMKYLHLADNRLEDDVFRELYMLPELRSLNLSYNELTDIPQGVLRRLANLTELYLSGNELTTLPSDDLEDGSNLKILHLNANRFQVLPAELCKVHKLSILDLGSNLLKYNVSNWPYDWNWNYNHNLKYLNFSGNKRLDIKPATSHQNSTAHNGVDLTSFSSLSYLRVLGLMDVTLTIPTTPEPTEDRRVRLSASLAGQISYGVADTLGRHDHLSILDMVVPRFRGREEETLVGLFDGQALSSGGSKVAKYLHETFREMLIEELSRLSDDDTGPLDALRRTFLSLNRNMAAAASQKIDVRENRAPRVAHRSSSVSQVLSHDDLDSGGVATVLYLHQTELFVANVGDAQAMLIQNNAQYKFLTTKHDPAYPRERERIREAGGCVSRQGKLNDILEVSRAFGFFQHMPSVIAAPHTLQVTLNDNDEMIVLASKEFWDFVTPDLAVDVARSEKADVMLAAQKLRDLAMAYGANNKIMVMAMGISDLRKRNNSRLRGTSLSMQPSYGQEDQLFPSKTRKRKAEGVGDSRLARLEEVEAPTGEVAIAFTDIKNSTALWEILPSAMRSAIQIHNELMRRQLRLIGGYEVKTEGDAFMVSFPTCTSALLWCFSCQSHLLDLAWPTEIIDTVHCQEKYDADQNMIYRGLSVRMGIHWGKPVCEQDPITRRMDYFGPMVNRASRISAVADGGQISVSSDFIAEIQRTLEAYADERANSTSSDDTISEDGMGSVIRRELRQLSSQGFEVKDLGEKKLKGLENPEYVYLMYPHSLAGRLAVQLGSDKSAEAGQSNEPGTLGKDSQLNIQPDTVWQLWDLALRLEMLCSTLECPDKAQGLNRPELSLLNRMKTQGGEISDAFMLNLLDHQVTRIEVSVTSVCTIEFALMLLPDLYQHPPDPTLAQTNEGWRQALRPRSTNGRCHGRDQQDSERVCRFQAGES
jgi:adenylate cyclase